ncbi:hypothetical protein B0T19DRAFT_401088 [Cercophora scortea]|uniref:Secreted protein n=1 Tax=Cercophora scortea TaxID=314031 RepID=A0AAE0INM7_9PEZI|nr:hypothetical protein B0T19DRAFT_401088 [Cercophora scortea]
MSTGIFSCFFFLLRYLCPGSATTHKYLHAFAETSGELNLSGWVPIMLCTLHFRKKGEVVRRTGDASDLVGLSRILVRDRDHADISKLGSGRIQYRCKGCKASWKSPYSPFLRWLRCLVELEATAA